MQEDFYIWKVLLKFVEPGLLLYHCHNLEHEDQGMMRNFRVTMITFWSAYKIVALGFNQAQWISLVGLAVAIPALIYLLRRRPVQPAVVG